MAIPLLVLKRDMFCMALVSSGMCSKTWLHKHRIDYFKGRLQYLLFTCLPDETNRW
jgi:hypothetical protein